MSGIAGIFHTQGLKPVDPARVERMCQAIAHRGPDGAGVWTAPGVGLGHRRLSIVDLAGSRQPMQATNGQAVMTLDGQIYNYRSLRHELEKGGARFRTDGDTEVILAAWQAWGPACLSRLEGTFAFALYDLRAKQLHLARDRFGVKPLYYTQLSDGSVAFGSELKAVLAHPLMRRVIDHRALEDYMAWGYVPDHRSILRGVHKLPPAHFLTLAHDHAPGKPSRWWELDLTRRASGSTRDQSVQLLHLMRAGVTSRMVADAPVGALLAGGVDSASVVALMHEASPSELRTASVGFDTQDSNGTSCAQAVASRFATDHIEGRESGSDVAELDRLAAIFDEPFADASALATLRLCQFAREHMTVALTGVGADEGMVGYRRQVFHHRQSQLRRVLPASWRQFVHEAQKQASSKAEWLAHLLLALAGDGAEGYARKLSALDLQSRKALYGEALLRSLGDYRAEEPVVALMRDAPARDGLDTAQYADLTFWLPGNILTGMDRTSMAVGLETREPLLHHPLVEFAATLPARQRVRGIQGKWLMKRTMERYLPKEILYRSRGSFLPPVSAWLRGPLAPVAKGLAHSEVLVGSGWFDRAALIQLAERHIAGRADNGQALWQLVMLERSLRHLAPQG